MPSHRCFLTNASLSDEREPLPRVYCFPHAGGNARTFLQWQKHLDGVAEFVGVVMAGRGHRVDEPSPTDLAEFIDEAAQAIAGEAERPVFLYGHSLGALTAFEVARRLPDLTTLRHLVVSGCSAPSLLPSQRVVDTSRLEGRAFAEAVAYFGGLPPEIVAAEELHALLLPTLQSDFRIVADYVYQPGEPLRVGLSLVNGLDDPHVDSASLQGWRVESATEPAFHWTQGGHFFFEQRPQAITDVLHAVVTASSATADQHVELI